MYPTVDLEIIAQVDCNDKLQFITDRDDILE